MCSIMVCCGTGVLEEEFKKGFDKTISRGPDMSRIIKIKNGMIGFHRLSIMGLNENAMQPFSLDESYVVCNGEIYGFRKLKKELEKKGYQFVSDSDCELLLPLYREYGTSLFSMLDAEYALVIYDDKEREFIAARDPIGIRPLFYGYVDDETILFASEAKNLVGLCKKILPFPPGHYYKGGKFVCYRDMGHVEEICCDNVETACRNIREKLIAGIEKRLDSDAPVGFLLSGGLDSSLVCSVAARLTKTPIKTFAIGMSTDAIDLKYAKQVAEFIGAEHTEVIITKQDVLNAL